MKIFRFLADGKHRWGIQEGEILKEIVWEDQERGYDRYYFWDNFLISRETWIFYLLVIPLKLLV